MKLKFLVSIFLLAFVAAFAVLPALEARAQGGEGGEVGAGVGQPRKKPITLKKKTYTPDDLKNAAKESETRTVTIQGLEGQTKVPIPDPFWRLDVLPDYSSNALGLAKFMPDLAAQLVNRFLRTKDLNARHKIIRKAIKNLEALITILDARIPSIKNKDEKLKAKTQRRLIKDALDALNKWKGDLDDEKDARDRPGQKPRWNWRF